MRVKMWRVRGRKGKRAGERAMLGEAYVYNKGLTQWKGSLELPGHVPRTAL